MIFEDDLHAVLHETSTKPMNSFAMITHLISFNGENSFILNSLQKLKNSTLCEIKKKVIEKFIHEYSVSFSGYVENDHYVIHNEGHRLCPSYARQSYEKALKEQEYLNRLITTLNTES